MRDRAGRTGSMTRRLRGCWPVVLFLGATLLVASPISAQQFITVPQGSVSLAKGTSVVLVNPAALSRVSIADPNVAVDTALPADRDEISKAGRAGNADLRDK